MSRRFQNRAQLSTNQKNTVLVINQSESLPDQRTCVIVGIERGGTSMVAGICRALGINFGDRSGLNHEDPRFLKDDFDLIEKHIKVRNQESDIWGFKAPKASMNLHFYEEKLRNPHYIFVYRNSLSIVDSWIQRRAGTMNDVLERIIKFHNAQLDLAKSSENPIMFVNYERAVSSDQNKKDFVIALAKFLGVQTDQNALNDALAMITGDGKGYVNLPSEYFYVSPTDAIPSREALKLEVKNNAAAAADGFLHYAVTAPGQIYRMVNGKNIPKRFFLELNLQTYDLDNFSENPVRIFFNFNGKRHPGHCARPAIAAGINRYYVETSGNAKDISFGVINPPKKLKFEVNAFLGKAEDVAYAQGPELITNISFVQKLWRKLRRS